MVPLTGRRGDCRVLEGQGRVQHTSEYSLTRDDSSRKVLDEHNAEVLIPHRVQPDRRGRKHLPKYTRVLRVPFSSSATGQHCELEQSEYPFRMEAERRGEISAPGRSQTHRRCVGASLCARVRVRVHARALAHACWLGSVWVGGWVWM